MRGGPYIIRGPNAAGHPEGTICYAASGHDYGLASDDTFMTGHRHVSVSLKEDGGYPLFTVRADHLEVTKASASSRSTGEA